MNKKRLIPLLLLLLLLTCGCAVDMTGASYAEIEAYRAGFLPKEVSNTLQLIFISLRLMSMT